MAHDARCVSGRTANFAVGIHRASVPKGGLTQRALIELLATLLSLVAAYPFVLEVDIARNSI